MHEPDLAGIYITDDRIDAVVGKDVSEKIRIPMLSTLKLDIDPKPSSVKSVHFKDDVPVERTIDKICEWIVSSAPNVRSIGIASYGPFESISREDRRKFMKDEKGSDSYGQLQSTTHGRLTEQKIAALFRSGIRKRINADPLITVDTDVSAAVIGEVYLRSWAADRKRDSSVDDQTFVFVKVSLGVGASFIRSTTTWRGRLHPEGGQFYVPRWQFSGDGDQAEVDRINRDEMNFVLETARNPGSIEALASVPAIQARFKGKTFKQLSQMPDHVAWDREAWYLAHMLWTLTCVVSPHCIVVGGRVMGVPGLIEKTRAKLATLMGHPSFPDYTELHDLASYIQDASDRDDERGGVGRPGVRGALCIAAMEPQYYEK